ARELLTLSRSSYRWTTSMGSPPAGAVTRRWPSVSTEGNRPPGMAANVSRAVGGRRAGELIAVMGSLLRPAPPGRSPAGNCDTAPASIPDDPHCSFLYQSLAPHTPRMAAEAGDGTMRRIAAPPLPPRPGCCNYHSDPMITPGSLRGGRSRV